MEVTNVVYLDGDKEETAAVTRAGKAKVTLSNGDVFEGSYDSALKKSGAGRYVWASGASYEGDYADGQKSGKGTYTYPNGDSFTGSWVGGLKHGAGKERFANGDSFKGVWVSDVREGDGEYTYASGAVLKGVWAGGQFKEGSWTLGDKRLSTRKILAKLGRRVSQAVSTKKKPAEASAEAAKPSKPLGIVISGAPASGKGTQCEYIREAYGVVHLSTGDMLRAAVAAGSELGLKAKELMESGQLVPDDVVIGAVKERLEQDDVQANGFLLDGFPRTAEQAKALDALGVAVDAFVMLNVPDSHLVARVVGRRIDPETGNSYHVDYSPPPAGEVADRCIQRADDTEEKVKVRLQGFHENISSIKSFYTDVTTEVDGTQKKEDVWANIKDVLDEAQTAK